MLKWILAAAGIYLIFLFTEITINYYFLKLQQKFVSSTDYTDIEKESH